MNLQSGNYLIYSVAYKCAIGRAPFELQSLTPKAVYCLGSDDKAPVWDVKQDEKGYYTFYANKSPTDSLRDKLYAFPSERDAHQGVWKLEETRTDGTFIIRHKESGNPWSLPGGDPLTQVDVDTMFVPQIYPPTFPSSGLFEFKRMGDLD